MALHACDQNALPSCATGSYQRPTAPALTGCELVFSSRQDQANRYVLLITNGAPDCGAGQNSGCADAQTIVTDMARNYSSAPSWWRRASWTRWPKTASKGWRSAAARRNAPYFLPASNQTELATTIGDIMRAIAMDACKLDLDGAHPGPDRVGVTWKDAQIPHDRNSGWDLTGAASRSRCTGLVRPPDRGRPRGLRRVPGLQRAPPLTRGRATFPVEPTRRATALFLSCLVRNMALYVRAPPDP